MNTLRAEGVSKRFGKKEVLHDLDLTLEPHKIYGLIGRNGAGKTTLLSLLSGQSPVSGGKVTFDGQPVWENEEVLSHICFSREISQMQMFGKNTMKGKEYLRIASIFYPHWDADYANRLVEEFGLDLKKRIDQMSKGMLSMLTIVVALASGADFTFLDEPVAGLDVAARDQFYARLNDAYIESDRTFVISTHIIEEAAGLLEEIILLNHGTIARKQNTEELLAQGLYLTGRKELLQPILQQHERELAILDREPLGSGETVMVVCKDAAFADQLIAKLPEGVSVAPVPLHKLFVGLTK